MVAQTIVTVASILFAPAVLCGASSSQASDPPRKASGVTTEKYPLKTPSGENVEAELWRLDVPENRQNPTSRLIEIAFVRLTSTAKQPGPPLVFLAGGPGGSGIEALGGPALTLFLSLREVGDVILLDQRGTGKSLPVLNSTVTWDVPLDKPGDPGLMLPIWKVKLRSAALALTQQGIDLSGYNPTEVADDIESVRIAVGAKRVNLWGVSYGTCLALATIRRHEKTVNRVVLTAVVGPDQALLKLPRAVQEQLERVHEILKGDEVASKVVPDFLGSLRRLLDQLDKKPVSVEITDPHTREAVRVVVGKWDLQFFMANQINKTYSLKSLAALSAQLFDGDLRPLARATLNFRRGSVGNLMPWEMLCSTGVSSERLRDIERRAVGTYLDNASNFPFPEIGEALSTRELGPEFRAPLHSKVPALFISGTLDGESPLASAKEIQDGFPNHSSLIVEGASHGWDLFYFAPGLKDQMVAFLSGRDLSSRRVNMLPFRFNAVGEGRE